jgi:mono/diheme cytochrome c family protein
VPLGAGQDPGRADYDGRDLFRTYCASCHGESARGDGPIAPHLRVPPANLTEFAKRNGTFDAALVAQVIDGRNPVRGHGGGDMPVWGDAFSAARGATPTAVDGRIRALVRYLETIQVK